MSITQDYLKEVFHIHSYGYMLRVSTKKDIKVCDICSGTGYLADYHRRDYSTFYNECKKCNCEGRLTETIQSLYFCDGDASHTDKSVVPYSQDPIMKPIHTQEEISLKSLLTDD